MIKKVFFILSLHWILKWIIKIRRGISFSKTFNDPVHKMFENDEEQANAVAALELEEENVNSNKQGSKNEIFNI